jgi:hypothetical protein
MGLLMAIYETQHADPGEDEHAENLPAMIDRAGAPVAWRENEDDPATTTIMPWSGPHGPVGAQYGPPGHIAPPHAIAALYGPVPLAPPLPLLKIRNFFHHLAESHLLPGLGVLTLAGLSGLAHSEPYHPLVGGAILGVGAWAVRGGVHAHRILGTGADPHFTKGLVGAGLGMVLIGTDVTTGLSWWAALATGAGLWAAYGAWHQWRHHLLERRREFHVAAVAAGNTGPVLTAGPTQPGPPGAYQMSDEEFRLRRAFTRIKAEQVIISPVRRGAADTWSVHVDLIDTKLTSEKLTGHADDLAAYTGARRVEIIPTRPGVAKLIVHDGDDPLEQDIPWPGQHTTSILDPVPLGRFEDGTELTLNLAWAHTLVAGTTDGGKSGVMNTILCTTLGCADLVRILVDCKAGAPEMRSYRNVAFHIATTPDDGMRTLAGIDAIYEYRGQLLVEKDVPAEIDEDGKTVRKWKSEFGPFILAAIDELAELTREVKGAAGQIQSLRAKQRFIGEFSLDATQTPSREVFDGNTDARLNYRNRIALATAEQGAARMIFGEGAVGRGWSTAQLDLPGKLLVLSREHRRPRIARGYLITDEDIARTVARFRGNVPTLDEGSAAAFWEAYHAWEPEAQSGGGGGPRGGKRTKSVEDAVPAAFGKPHLVVVPRYPDGAEVEEKDARLWQLLGEFGAEGATRNQLAARAEARKHPYASPPWVGQRLAFWKEKGYVRFEKEGREDRHWRTDLRADQQRKDA